MTIKKTPLDSFLKQVDIGLRTLFPPQVRVSQRETPAKNLDMPELSHAETKHVAGLMRVNHAGEICAQALYQGQAIGAKKDAVRLQMQKAADEEIDHLAWCEQRLFELQSQTSLFNPIWYGGALLLGITAGFAGDKWSLGFVAETERQVTEHLKKHIEKLPIHDNRTKLILEQMRSDEQAHAESAVDAGAADLPEPIKFLMSMVSKLMTRSSYYI